MKDRFFAGSLTRIADFATDPFDVAPVEREEWRDADYVIVEVIEPGDARNVELPTGRLTTLESGDRLIGALGVRHATLEATGDWRAVGPDLRMELLTSAGLLGRVTSVSALVGPLTRVAYRGHVVRNGTPVRMGDFVEGPRSQTYATPTILIIGTSMSAGKTATARMAIRHLVRNGVAVAGAKLTGAGRYRDILTMRDAGAETIVDFVDAGLPSTVCSAQEFGRAADLMLARIEASGVDAAVIEAGASPLEPYNGAGAIAAIGDNVRMAILAASDPYAVLGVMQAFGLTPDLVTGITSNTRAGIELVERLTKVSALNVMDPGSSEEFGRKLEDALGLG